MRSKCYICGYESEGGCLDECPNCDWVRMGFEEELDPDERDEINLMSINHAKEMVAAGMTVHGKPLPKQKLK